MIFQDKVIAITGGTGSLGKQLVQRIMTGDLGKPGKVIIFSHYCVTQHRRVVRRVCSLHNSGDLKTTFLLNYIDTGSAMTTSPDQYQLRSTHGFLHHSADSQPVPEAISRYQGDLFGKLYTYPNLVTSATLDGSSHPLH